MSERLRLSAPPRRVRLAAIISLMLLTTGGALLGTWSALAHPQEDQPAVASGTPGSPSAAPTPEATAPQDATITPSGEAPATAAAAAAAPRPAPTNVTPYTLVQTQTITPVRGAPWRRATRERYQRSDGWYAVRHTYYQPDGGVEAVVTGIGYAGAGDFRADDERQTLELIATTDGPAAEGELRGDENFDREETVLGQSALVLRFAPGGEPDRAPGEDARSGSREVYLIPELQGAVVKEVRVSARGREEVEPTSLAVGEPDGRLFLKALNYRKSYALYEAAIRRAEAEGRAGQAEQMRRRLARIKERG